MKRQTAWKLSSIPFYWLWLIVPPCYLWACLVELINWLDDKIGERFYSLGDWVKKTRLSFFHWLLRKFTCEQNQKLIQKTK